jgi:hypothetical protein
MLPGEYGGDAIKHNKREKHINDITIYYHGYNSRLAISGIGTGSAGSISIL